MTLSKTADANLDCAFVENSLFSPIVKSQHNGIELVIRPGDECAALGDVDVLVGAGIGHGVKVEVVLWEGRRHRHQGGQNHEEFLQLHKIH